MICLMCLLGLSLLAEIQPPAKSELAPLDIKLPEQCIGGPPLSQLELDSQIDHAYFSTNLEREPFPFPPPFLAPKSARVLSVGAVVTASAETTRGELKKITDGDKECEDAYVVELPAGKQWIQVDLGAPKTMYAVALWHWHKWISVYFDVVVQASNDPEFKSDVTVLYNNDNDNDLGFGAGRDKEYFERFWGRVIDARGIKAQYLRLYSRGNVRNEYNHYIEVEVWGE